MLYSERNVSKLQAINDILYESIVVNFIKPWPYRLYQILFQRYHQRLRTLGPISSIRGYRAGQSNEIFDNLVHIIASPETIIYNMRLLLAACSFERGCSKLNRLINASKSKFHASIVQI